MTAGRTQLDSGHAACSTSGDTILTLMVKYNTLILKLLVNGNY